ncbi:streptophobe family protein [Streptomyces chengmaiensis]|uniref:streptophobe family protein n=1 Tax=Streptomyces chengmaiensis TaxID=3040919 RepID=UPI002961E84E|nr:streptophobe family protein [Streptomyces chengmaiensis]
MDSVRYDDNGRRTPSVRWGRVLLSAVAAVSWALAGMAGAAALGLHLLGADATASVGPMTAAAVVLAIGGSVTPTGDVSAFGIDGGAQARTAVDIAPLGVGLVGALLLAYVFLRSLRIVRPYAVHLAAPELLARAAAVAVLFVAMTGGLAWAGHDVITIDGLEVEVPSADLPVVGDLLPGGTGEPVRAEAAVGYSVNTADSLAGAAVWVVGVLIVALLSSRRTPLPRGAVWEAVRKVRPAVSAVVTVALTAVLAGYAAAGYAAIGDENPGRIAGAALLGAPNGVWVGLSLGLFVPWEGRVTGGLERVLPHPLDELLVSSGSTGPVTVGRLAELDGRVWLLSVAAGVAMLCAGVLAAERSWGTETWGCSATRFTVRTALRLGLAAGAGLALLVWLTGVSVDASLSVLGIDAVGAEVALRGATGVAALLGAVWGAGAGAVGGLLVYALMRGEPRGGAPDSPGPYQPSAPSYRAPNPDTNPYLRLPGRWDGRGRGGG